MSNELKYLNPKEFVYLDPSKGPSDYTTSSYIPSPKGKTPFHAKILAIGETRIKILEEKAEEAKMWPGVEYPKILTAIKEIKIYLDLIRETK